MLARARTMTKAASVCLALLAWSAALFGQADAPPTSTDKAAAQALFDEGRALLEDEQHEAACKKFEESHRLDPAVGTQLNLARCYELVGKSASAWINFIEAAARARKERQPAREKLARRLAADLEPSLSRMVIDVAERVEGMVVRRDGTVVREAQWGTAVPVDPGAHKVSVSAPGFLPWSTMVEVGDDGTRHTVAVEPLIPQPPSSTGDDAELKPVTPPSDADEPAANGTTQRALGIVSASVGFVGLVVGTAAGVTAMNNNDDSLEHCPVEPNRCTAEGVDLRDAAITAGTVSTVGFIVGAAALTTGAILLFTAPGDDSEADEDEDQNTAGVAGRLDLQVSPDIAIAPAPSEPAAPPAWTAGFILRGTF